MFPFIGVRCTNGSRIPGSRPRGDKDDAMKSIPDLSSRKGTGGLLAGPTKWDPVSKNRDGLLPRWLH